MGYRAGSGLPPSRPWAMSRSSPDHRPVLESAMSRARRGSASHPSRTSCQASGRSPRRLAEAVLDAARRLQYRPTVAARGLATGRTMAIGLQFPMEGEHLIPQLPTSPNCWSRYPPRRRSTATRSSSFQLTARPNFLLEPLLDTQRLDAAILVDPSSANDVLPLLRRYHVPIVDSRATPGPGEHPLGRQRPSGHDVG